jgi:hypothetical protein
MPFRDQIRLAYSSSFKRQTSQGTALANGEMDKTMTATLITYSREARFKYFLNCDNQTMRRKETVSRLSRATLEFDMSPHLGAGFLAGTMGVTTAPTGTDPKSHVIKMLPASERELTLHTFIYGHDDGSGEAWGWFDVAFGKWRAQASSGQDSVWRCMVDIVGGAARTSKTGWVWPVCVDEDPANLYDGLLTLDGVQYMDTSKSIYCEYDNRPLTNDAPFVNGSLDVKRILRSPQVGYSIGASILGADRPGDTLATKCRANDDAGTIVADSTLRIGTATNGITIEAPSGYLSADGSSQSYYGEAEEGVLNVIVEPLGVAGDSTSPLNALAVIPSAQQSTQFEVAG